MRQNLKTPYGYSTATRTLAEVESLLLQHYHPEYVDRFVHWLDDKDGLIGVGGHWRRTQPDKPGFAPDGQSFHQDQYYADGFVGACAVDVVKANPGGKHIAVSWSDVPTQGTDEAKRYGVHANVTGEAWHIQPVEIDGWASWRNAGSPAPKPNYLNNVERPYGIWPTIRKETIKYGSRGDGVRYAQMVMTNVAGQELLIDGWFGSKTATATTNVQRFFGLTVDGIIGPQTWATLDFLSTL